MFSCQDYALSELARMKTKNKAYKVRGKQKPSSGLRRGGGCHKLSDSFFFSFLFCNVRRERVSFSGGGKGKGIMEMNAGVVVIRV